MHDYSHQDDKLIVMGDIEKFACDNSLLKYHTYYKYHVISKLASC